MHSRSFISLSVACLAVIRAAPILVSDVSTALPAARGGLIPGIPDLPLPPLPIPELPGLPVHPMKRQFDDVLDDILEGLGDHLPEVELPDKRELDLSIDDFHNDNVGTPPVLPVPHKLDLPSQSGPPAPPPLNPKRELPISAGLIKDIPLPTLPELPITTPQKL